MLTRLFVLLAVLIVVGAVLAVRVAEARNAPDLPPAPLYQEGTWFTESWYGVDLEVWAVRWDGTEHLYAMRVKVVPPGPHEAWVERGALLHRLYRAEDIAVALSRHEIK